MWTAEILERDLRSGRTHPLFNVHGKMHWEYFIYQHKENGTFAVHRVGLDHLEAIFFTPNIGSLLILLSLDIGDYVDDQADLELGLRDPREDEIVITREERR